MPRYAIAINGQNHVFEGPSADAAARFAQQWARNNPEAVGAARPGDSTLGGLVDTFNRSVPGLSEMGAGLAAGGAVADDLMAGRPADFGARWTQARAHQQRQIDQLRNDHPILANMTTGVGLAAPLAAALATGGATAAPVMAQSAPGLGAAAARLAATTGRNALTGAVVGGAYGASQPGTLSQRLKTANQNLLPGAAAGVVAPALVGASRLGLAGVRALTGETNATSSALYDASPNAIGGAEEAPNHQLPSSVADRLRALPKDLVAMPDDEFAAMDRIQDNRTSNLSADIRNHFKNNASGMLLDPILDDDDFKGYTGSQIAEFHGKLADLANHYRPQGENGEVLANEIDQLNANFKAMAARTQPEFAKAMAGAFEPSHVLSLAQHLRPNMLDLSSSLGKPPPEFDAADLIASAANDDFPLEVDLADPAGITPRVAMDQAGNSQVLNFARDAVVKEVDPKALPDEFKNRFSAEHFIASAANDNLPEGDLPLVAPVGSPTAIADDLAARNEQFRSEVDPGFLAKYDQADPTQRRQLEAALRDLIPKNPDAPLPAGVVDFRQRQSADPGLSPTLESAAARSIPSTGSPGGAPNAFTGADSNVDLAGAIAAREPGRLSDPNYDFTGLKVVLPLSNRGQDAVDPTIDQQDQ